MNIEQMKQQLKALEDKETVLSTAIEQMEEIQSKTYKEEQKAVEKLEEEITRIKRPYIAKIAQYQKSIEKTNSYSQKIYSAILDLKNQIAIAESIRNNRHTEASLMAYSDLYKIVQHGCDNIIRKPMLANGIEVFKLNQKYGRDNDFWLAFRGTDLVGISARRKGEHRGDTTFPVSFIGQTKKQLLVTKEDRWRGMNTVEATYTDWYQELGKIADPMTIKVIEPSVELFNEIKNLCY